MKQRSTKKIVVVTGTSSGIGRATVFTLAQAGYYVLAGVRKEEDSKSIKEESKIRNLDGAVEPLILDITNNLHIQNLVQILETKTRKGDQIVALVNNAGYLEAGAVETMPLKIWRAQYDVLLFGQVAIIQAMLPFLRLSSGKVLNITSIGGIVPGPMLAAYQSAKAAFEAFSDSLRMEVQSQGISVIAVAPGAISTVLLQESEKKFSASLEQLSPEMRSLYGKDLQAYEKIAVTANRLSTSAETASKVILKVVNSKHPKTRYLIGYDAFFLATLKRNLPDKIMDRVLKRLLGIPKN